MSDTANQFYDASVAIMGGKTRQNKRVDNCLLNLLKFVRDKYFESHMKLTKGKCNYKMRMIQDIWR